MPTSLFDYFEALARRVAELEPTRDGKAFGQEIARHKAPALSQLPPPNNSVISEIQLTGVAMVAMTNFLRPLPEIIDTLLLVARDATARIELRCAVVGALAVAYQTRDLIPDDAPGGYGFLDSAIVLHAAYAALREAHPATAKIPIESENPARGAMTAAPKQIAGELSEAMGHATVGFITLGKVAPGRLKQALTYLLEHSESVDVQDLFYGLAETAGPTEGLAQLEDSQKIQVFLSYRRADSGERVERLYNKLSASTGSFRVFLDVHGIKPAERFTETIKQSIADSNAFIPIIGRDWLEIKDDRGKRRISQRHDVLRREIEWALEHDATVLPVLVGGAAMPSERSLPKPLRRLHSHQALLIEDARFDEGVLALRDRLLQLK